MPQVTACRACLAENLNMYRVTDSPYKEIYEKLTNAKLGTVYPNTFCYICVSILRKFRKFSTLAISSNVKLQEWYRSETERKPATQPLFTISTTTVEYVSTHNDTKDKVEIKTEKIDDTNGEDQTIQFIESTREIDRYETTPQDDPMDTSWSDDEPKLGTPPEEFEVPIVKLESKKRVKTEKTPKGTPATKKRKTSKKSQATPKNTDQATKDINDPSQIGTTKFTCNFCSLALLTRRSLKSHLETRHKVNWLICDICRYKAVDESELLLHSKKHEKPRHGCNICPYKSRSKSDLEKHERVHTGVKPYSCKHCEYKCKSRGDLTRHELTHTKPFSCDLCDYNCSTRQNLKYHTTVTHIKDKTYMCHICSFRVIERSQLRRHLRTHESPDRKKYECNVCDRKFSVKNYLTVHLRVHTGEQPYSCNICSRKFSQKSALNKHIKQVHNKKENL